MSTPVHQRRISDILNQTQRPEWPNNIFPAPLEEFVKELARSIETPIELPALVVIAVLSSVAQGKYRVQVKEDYFEPVNVWTCVALPSGQRKSAVYAAATKPVVEWEKLQAERLKVPIQQAKSKNELILKRIEALRHKKTKSDQWQLDECFKEIQRLEGQLLEIPRIPRLCSADITPENLGIVMAENGGRMALLSDEGGIFDNMAGRYSGGVPNLDVFLQGHAGTAVRVDRTTRQPIFIEKPALTLGLTVQSELLQGLTKCRSFRGRGLLARFLYAVPQPNIGYRSFETTSLTQRCSDEYRQCIFGILEQPWKDDGCEPYTLKLSKGAFDIWRITCICNESWLRDDGKLAHLQDWGSKLTGAVIRLAALFHIARHAQSEPWEYEISSDDMRSAINLGEVLVSHALIAFDLMGSDQATDGARIVLRWIQKMRLEMFSYRECQYQNKNYFKKTGDLRPAIDILVDLGVIARQQREQGKGRPSEIYIVSDEFIEEF